MMIGIIKARDVPSIGLQKVVISTSSTQSNVLSGFLSASMMKSRSVDATSAFCTHEQSTGSASSAAVWTFAFESLRHSMTRGMHSGRHGPIVPGACVASMPASLRHSMRTRPPPPTTPMPSYSAPTTALTERVERPSIIASAATVAASATFLSLSASSLISFGSAGTPYGSKPWRSARANAP